MVIECRGSLELEFNLSDGPFTAVRDVYIHEDGDTADPGLSMDTGCELYRLVSSTPRTAQLIFRCQRIRQVYKSFVSYTLLVPFWTHLAVHRPIHTVMHAENRDFL